MDDYSLVHTMISETNNLRRIREARKLSQDQLALKAATSQSQIDRMEKDGIPGVESRKFTKRWAIRLAPHLGCTVEELMGLSAAPAVPVRLIICYHHANDMGKSAIFRFAEMVAEHPHLAAAFAKAFAPLIGTEDGPAPAATLERPKETA